MAGDKHLYGIGIGSNRVHGRLGRPQTIVEAAIARLEADYDLFDASAIIGNPAFGGAGRDFANAAVLLESELEPEAMLAALKMLEFEFGRRAGKRWGPRVLDLDILAWDGGSFASAALSIPHPALLSRQSALFPLAQIAPDWRIQGSLQAKHLAARLRAPKRKFPQSA